MSILITTEATADIPESLFRDDLKIIPMGYTVNGIGYDGYTEKLSNKDFYNAVAQAKSKEDLPQTTMVTSFTATEFFDKYLSQGYDIIHIGFSSKLSGTLDQLNMAAKELKEKYPERKLTVIDSLSASFVEGLVAYYACHKKDEGASYEEIVDYVESIKQNAYGIFVIDDLNHLCRTGRATKNEAFLGTLLQIKPMLYISETGTLEPYKKAMSTKKALKTMLEDFKNVAFDKDKNLLIAVGCADNEPDRALVIDSIKAMGYTNVIPYDVGPVVGTHVGKGMVSIIFMGKERSSFIK